MHFIYTVLFYLILPFLFIRLWWKSRKQPTYSERWKERLGMVSRVKEQTIWIHAVSLGEVIAAKSLVKAIQQNFPNKKVIITTMTATGSNEAKKLTNDSTLHFFVPYDVPCTIKIFLKRVHPQCLIIMETELWPNLLYYSKKMGMPILLANARLSDTSFKNYKRFPFLSDLLFKQLTHVMAQSDEDADRFKRLGVAENKITSAGNLKFEMSVPDEQVIAGKTFKETYFKERPVWIAASTHAGEEEIILLAQQEIMKKIPSALLVLVPRHPERFAEVEKLCLAKGFNISKRSESINKDCTIFLGNSVGELFFYYAMSDVAFVGGSLIDIGGHNLLEPAALRLPIISGQYVSNFKVIAALLKQENGLISVNDGKALTNAVIELLLNPNEKNSLGDKAYSVIANNRQALKLHMEWLQNNVLQ